MKIWNWPVIVMLMVGFMSCQSGGDDIQTVNNLNPQRFTGQWYEVAGTRIGSEDCICQSYNYLPMQEGGFRILKRCKKKDGSWKNEKAKAWPIHGSDHSRLEVEYQWPFSGSLYIFSISIDYKYALVGNPDKQNMQILSKEKQPDPSIIRDFKAEAHRIGFDTSRVKSMEQSCKF